MTRIIVLQLFVCLILATSVSMGQTPAPTPEPPKPIPQPTPGGPVRKKFEEKDGKKIELPPDPYKPILRIVPEKTLVQNDRDSITAALPNEPIVPPKKPRKILVFDLNVDYQGHRSIVCANFAFTELGKKTKAFEAVVSHDPESFQAEKLKEFDAVVFNNTVGDVIADPKLRQNLDDFVKNGGGLLAIHAATETGVGQVDEMKGKDDWPLFGQMIGARGNKHRETDERVFVRVDDPENPLTKMFPREGFIFRDEFIRFDEPYSRTKQRILLSIDNAKSNLPQSNKERADGDYALAWTKMHGKGRCVYSVFGHNARTFWDPMMIRFYLAAIQFVAGDLDASTEPSKKP